MNIYPKIKELKIKQRVKNGINCHYQINIINL